MCLPNDLRKSSCWHDSIDFNLFFVVVVFLLLFFYPLYLSNLMEKGGNFSLKFFSSFKISNRLKFGVGLSILRFDIT